MPIQGQIDAPPLNTQKGTKRPKNENSDFTGDRFSNIFPKIHKQQFLRPQKRVLKDTKL